MEKTYILGNSHALKELGGAFIKIPYLNTNEKDKIHDWLIPVFDKNEIERVVIEIGENPLLSLQIGYHIRLSIDDLKKKSLVPILFVSTLSLNFVLLQTEIYSQILATKGVFFSEFELQSIQQEVKHLTGLNESEYLTKFLKTIHVQPDETVGRHSLANIWGAYAMDKAANTNTLPSDAKFKKTLYFKYISAFNNLDKLKPSPLKILGRISIGGMNKIEARDKRILLLDDEADKGWETVLRKVFKTTIDEDFVVINEKVKDYDTLTEASKRTIETEEFDLYLIDLRLNGLEEDENVNTDEFSGMKVLRKIKSLNKGNQVIIFTASNKVWNLKALLDAGADDYYMKESPEYNLSGKISKQNYTDFKQNVQKCFNRSYLRSIFQKTKLLKDSKLTKEEDIYSLKELKNTIKHNLDIAFVLSKENTTLEYALFNYLQILESFCNFFTYFDKRSSRAIVYKSLDDRIKRINEVVIYEVKEDKIHSNYKYKKDFYYFQKNKKEGKDEQFVDYSYVETIYENDKRFFSFALKLVSVLKEQLNDISKLSKLMELIFIRNNKIAHSGQNFDRDKRKVNKNDIKDVFEVIYQLLNKVF